MSVAVVVTGLGAIGAHGLGHAAMAAALERGAALTRPLPEPEPISRRRRARVAALCPELDLTPWLAPRAARRMSRLSQWAVVAGRMALEHAGVDAPEGLAVSLASVFGPSEFVNKLLIQILRESPRAASPFLFTDCVANAPSGQLAIAVGARAANYTISQREAGPVLSLIQGALELRNGRATSALVGSIDEVDEKQVAILDRMRVLTAADAPRPNVEGRDGFVCGEGAGVLFLETAATAQARGARPLARVAAMVRGFDPSAPAADFGTDGAGLGAMLRQRLSAAGIAPGSIDLVVSGASGSVAGDRLEQATLRAALGAELPTVVTPKAVFGEYGAGGVCVPAVLALQNGARRALVCGLGTGGAAAFVVLDACIA